MRDTIFIFDNDNASRTKLTSIFHEKYKILEVTNGKEGLDLFRSHVSSIAAVLINISLLTSNDFRVLEQMEKRKVLHRIPFIMITNDNSTEYEKKGYGYGMIGSLKPPFDSDVIRLKVNNVIEMFQYRLQLEVTVKNQTERLKKQNTMLKLMAEKHKQMYGVLVDSLSNIVEFRNLESEQHIKRIREFSTVLGTSIMKLYSEYELTEEKIDLIGWASSLHDIGKIVIPDNIILKAGKLTDDEYEVIKSHTTKGAEIIEKVIHIDNKEFCDYAYDIARHHHEKYDGNGYPDGLKGEEISIAAQIIALVDVYDALTSKRVYKAAYNTQKAYQIILNGQSGAFSSKLLKAFTEVKKDFEIIVNKYCDD